MGQDQSPKLVESVLRAARLLQAYRSGGELLRLRDFTDRTSLSKATAHRLLRTLQEAGLIERAGKDKFRSRVHLLGKSSVRIGFASQAAGSTFSIDIAKSIERAAQAHSVNLVMLNNRYSAKAAFQNAELFIRERVDLAIEFQTYETIAAALTSRFLEAGIPIIALEIPHPGAIYFGANNYSAGLMGGRALAKWAIHNWDSHVDEVLLLEEQVAGPVPRSRITGMLAGIREMLPGLDSGAITVMDGKGSFRFSLDLVRHKLKIVPAKRTLVAAQNDQSALGALRAFEECGRSKFCAVMGQNAVIEARDELRRPGTRLVGSVAYFAETYGDRLIPLALAILAGKPCPPAVFTKHRLVTPDNVDEIYPLESHSVTRPVAAFGGPD